LYDCNGGGINLGIQFLSLDKGVIVGGGGGARHETPRFGGYGGGGSKGYGFQAGRGGSGFIYTKEHEKIDLIEDYFLSIDSIWDGHGKAKIISLIPHKTPTPSPIPCPE
jgi:hypothetical protein